MAQQKLRILGTSVTLFDEMRECAMNDLGFDIEYEILEGVQCQQKGVMSPGEFDIYDQWFNSVDLLWTAGAIQPIDTSRIDLWEQVGDLTKTGRLNKSDKLGQGARPVDVQFIQDVGALGANPSNWISMLPTAHNVDAFGYDPVIRKKLGPDCEESWAWLFDERWHGKCGLHDNPSIGIADVALAAQAAGLIQFEDIGNMSINEIDDLIALLIERKKSGHFRHFWSTLSEAISMMERPSVLLAGIWSPVIFTLHAKGRPIVCASPVEGYRGWHSGLSLSSELEGEKLELAYAYLNWWLSGKAGAIIARQGYYISVPQTIKQYLSEAEWDYWYSGKPAQVDLYDPHGQVVVRQGDVRDGGSYQSRMSNIAVWITLMDEHNYLVRRWNEFLST